MKYIIILFILLPGLCFSQMDTSKCFVKIINPISCKFKYAQVYEVMKYDEKHQDWKRVCYMELDKKTVIRTGKRKRIVYIESSM